MTSTSSSTINIRVKDTSNVLKIITIPVDSTIGDLRTEIACQFNILQIFDLLWGYPPSICNLSDTTTIDGNITKNDNVRVQLSDQRGQAEGVGTGLLGKGKGGNKKAKSPSSSSSSSSNNTNNPGFGSRIATLSSPSGRSRGKKRQPRPISGQPARQRRRVIDNSDVESSGDGQQDIMSALMSAAEGGGGGRDKALRSVFRAAVHYQYDSSTAVARLSASYAGRYTFEPCENSRVLTSGESTKMKVTFPKNVGTSSSKSDYIDVVNIVSEEVLRATLLVALQDDDIGAREMLKPINLAKASPTIFWSIIRCYGPDISVGMANLFPDVSHCHLFALFEWIYFFV